MLPTALDLYEMIHTGTPGDVAFYVDACAGAARVLELGCGGGRVLLPVSDVAGEVVGLDRDAAAVARALERAGARAGRRVRAVCGDMRRFDLAGRFDRVLVPYNALYALASDEEVVACLACAAAHLAPGGRVLFDGYRVPFEDVPVEELEAAEPEHVATVVERGWLIDVVERSWPVAGDRNLRVAYEHRVRLVEGGEVVVVESILDHHWLRAADVPRLVAAAGLELEALWGDFAGSPLDEESEHLVVSARAGAQAI